MNVIPITCDNCGAKYKLPPTFKGTQAKCQKCGSVIDVAGQRAAADSGDGGSKPAAAAKPAKARPAAAAKPAVDRSKSTRRSASAGASAKSDKAERLASRSSSNRSRRGGEEDGNKGGRASRREREPQKSNSMPLILGGVGLAAILGVGIWFMMSEDAPKKDDTKETAKLEANDTKASDTKATDANASKATADEAAKAAAANAGAKGEMPKPAAGDAPAAGEPAKTPAETPAAGTPAASGAPEVPLPSSDDPTRTKEPWEKQRNPARSMDEVQSAAELYGEVQWPASIDAEAKAEVMGLAEDLDAYGGMRHIRAKRNLSDKGYPALFAILERLRTLDYKSTDDAAFGFELNRMIQEMTGGLNARYAAVEAGETLHPAKAQWNTKNVKAWMTTFAKWPDEATFKKAKKARIDKGK
ncbi:MAG: hypothetical protein AB8H80_06965 [Planctomycetota bacterium]